jgi:hypothetical protein
MPLGKLLGESLNCFPQKPPLRSTPICEGLSYLSSWISDELLSHWYYVTDRQMTWSPLYKKHLITDFRDCMLNMQLIVNRLLFQSVCEDLNSRIWPFKEMLHHIKMHTSSHCLGTKNTLNQTNFRCSIYTRTNSNNTLFSVQVQGSSAHPNQVRNQAWQMKTSLSFFSSVQKMYTFIF